ncbi:glycosyltransferase family 2 protein [Candidatus Bathyarchaeota archaeon]|nr:glycosyltransferase family 2 protein [Candidatus Bathyarchaeota archaeon]
MPHKISIFIPVYRESCFLEHLLTYLLNDPYENKEILVVVDEPAQRSLDISKKFSDKVHFIFNGERKGKANVLNEIVNESTGDVCLFLDSDVLLDVKGKGESFLEAIAKEMDCAEIVEVKKGVIKDSFISRIASYDYLGFNLTSWYFSRRIGRCLGINGAAFAIKREIFEALGGFRRVICEDLDIATRAFINNARFKFIDKVTAYTRVPSSWKEWFNQRKRWGVGAAFWFKEHFKLLRRVLKEHPEVAIPSLLFIFPALPLLIMNLFMPDDLSTKMLYISLILLSTKTNLLLPPTALTSTTISTLKSFFVVIGNLAASSLIFYIFARRIRFPFNPIEFLIFYFVMAPVWLLIIVTSLIKVYIKPENIKIDWKV